MELTVCDSLGAAISMLAPSYFDMEIGADNNFKLTLPNATRLEVGYRVYAIGTDCWGVVDGMDDTSDSNSISYTGRTWSGVLDGAVIRPDAGQSYLTVAGSGNAVLRQLVSRLGLSGVFYVPSSGGVNIPSWTFSRNADSQDSGRYCGAWNAIRAMLAANSGKLRAESLDGTVLLTVVPQMDYTTVPEWDSDQVDVRIKTSRCINHLVCLGEGEMADRTVIDLYADAFWNITKTQSLFGIDEIADVYDCSNDDASSLESDGIKKLRSYQDDANTVSVKLGMAESSYDVGDVVGGVDNRTGITASAAIEKKIWKLENGSYRATYE